MRSTITNKLALVLVCYIVTATIVIDFVATPASAQESKSGGDDDREDSGRRRRGSWGSWRRDRDRDEDRDDQPSEKSSSTSDSQRASKDDASDDSPGMTPETYAKQLVDKLDKNDNKVLDGEERTALTGPARNADFNKDGFISGEEIAASIAGATAASSAPAGKSSTSAAPKEVKGQENDKQDKGGSGSKSALTAKRVFTWIGGGKAGEEGKITRRTYRFTPARERLPNELPSWFKSQDKNGDGQVAMSEYSRSWSKSTVARFQGYDTNGDGVVTVKEAKGEKVAGTLRVPLQ
jgi:hypothetical protein